MAYFTDSELKGMARELSRLAFAYWKENGIKSDSGAVACARLAVEMNEKGAQAQGELPFAMIEFIAKERAGEVQ